MIDPVVKALLESPIGDRAWSSVQSEGSPGKEAARRAQKVWLPEGRRSANAAEAREMRRALAENQIDLEDAIEAAGGNRGSLAA